VCVWNTYKQLQTWEWWWCADDDYDDDNYNDNNDMSKAQVCVSCICINSHATAVLSMIQILWDVMS